MYLPQGPQWSSFDKSTLRFKRRLHVSIFHLPVSTGSFWYLGRYLMTLIFKKLVIEFIVWLWGYEVMGLWGYRIMGVMRLWGYEVMRLWGYGVIGLWGL